MSLFGEPRGAILSACRTWRYRLWREWDPQRPRRLLLMLNPADADAERDDLTVTKCIAIARNLGFGRLDIGNLAAYRTPHPDQLLSVPDPIGPENDSHLADMIGAAAMTVCAWGNGADILPGRVQAVATMLRHAGVTPYAFRLTQSGCLSHPLARGKSYFPTTIKPLPSRLPDPA